METEISLNPGLNPGLNLDVDAADSITNTKSSAATAAASSAAAATAALHDALVASVAASEAAPLEDLVPVNPELIADGVVAASDVAAAMDVSGAESVSARTVQLATQGLVKSYGAEPILDGINLQVHQGEVVVVLGPSGCGKSTLLRCLIGLEALDAGSIILDGEELKAGAASLAKLQRRLGMVFQSYDLFPHLTIMENVTLAPRIVAKVKPAVAAAEAERLLKRVGLWEKRDMYPRQLSGGQRQRVAIVRALCMHPEVMLFDEVTAALDPEMVREVLDVVLELARQGLTMVIVTHEMQFARAIADRIVFLDKGKVVEESDPESFFTAPRSKRAQEFLQTFTFNK